jgi:hypothetical protein
MPGDQPIAWPKAEEASRAVREYLTALDAARSPEEKDDDNDGGSSGGGSRRKPAKEVSLTDPQAAWVTRKGIDPFFAYDANYLIDNKAGIIVDAETDAAFGVERIRKRTDRALWSSAQSQTRCQQSRHRRATETACELPG